ncbi:pectin lyase fold/virulence factor [Lipomyces japonicus]|uniref:pectin lyase fold/virulence factor n=1 Tax=Lipomyces japonicus TaxID=56871 RepID=UPI0034CD568B
MPVLPHVPRAQWHFRYFQLLLLGLLSLIATARAFQHIDSYNLPAGVFNYSETFSVLVNNEELVEVVSFYDYDYVHFSLADASQTSKISIFLLQDVSNVTISPRKLNISATTDGGLVWFDIDGPQYLIVKIDDLKELVILIDPPEQYVPSKETESVFNVTDYGADSSGVQIATDAFQSAIADVENVGGGVVFVPPGVYTVGNIKLPSHAKLYLEAGSVLQFSNDVEIYEAFTVKRNEFTSALDRNLTWWIYTEFDSENVGIYGRGTINGRANYILESNTFEANLIVPIKTSNFVFDGPLLRESGSWAFIPTMSKNVTISNVKILNSLKMQENDGIDVMHSDNVVVNNGFVASGDDSYSLKTWIKSTDIAKSWPDDFVPNTNIVFSNTIAWTGCIGWKVGYGNYYGLDNFTVLDSTLYQGAIGLGIDSKEARASATIQNVNYKNIFIESIVVGHDLYFSSWLSLVTRVDRTPGVSSGAANIIDVLVENVTILDFGGKDAFIYGYNGTSQISNVTLINIIVPGSDTPIDKLSQALVTKVQFAENVVVIQ